MASFKSWMQQPAPGGVGLGAEEDACLGFKLLDEGALQAIREELAAEEAEIRGAKGELTVRKSAARARKMELADAERELKKLEAAASKRTQEPGSTLADGNGLLDLIRAWNTRFVLADTQSEDTLDGLRRALQALQREHASEEAALRQRKGEVLNQDMAFRFRRSVLAEAQDEVAALVALEGEREEGAELSEESLARFLRAMAKLQPLQEALLAPKDELDLRKDQMRGMVRSRSGHSLKSSSSWASFASIASTEEEETRTCPDESSSEACPPSPSSAAPPVEHSPAMPAHAWFPELQQPGGLPADCLVIL